MNTISMFRTISGETLDFEQFLGWPLYSTMEIAAADGIDLRAFNYIPGGQVSRTPTIASRNANARDTNMIRRSRMGQDESFVVFAITYEIFSMSAALTGDSPPQNAAPVPLALATDIRRLQRDCVVELVVGDGIKKPQVRCTFSDVQQAIGAQAYTSGDAGAAPAQNIHYGTGGCITPRAQRLFGLPCFIGGQGEANRPGNSIFFNLRFRAPRGPVTGLVQNVRIRWWLDGVKSRPG